MASELSGLSKSEQFTESMSPATSVIDVYLYKYCIYLTEEGTSKPIIAKTTETPADSDGIVTVYLDDLVSWNNPPTQQPLHQQV